MNATGIIFRRTLRDSRGGILGWGIGIGLITVMVILLYPTLTQFEGFAQMLESPIYKAMLGEMADAAAFLSPEGFIAVYVLALAPLYLAVYLVILGLNVTAGEEERGTVDLLLSTPTPRWQVIVEKFAAMIVITVLIFAINYVMALAALALTPEMDVSPLRMAEGKNSPRPLGVMSKTFQSGQIEWRGMNRL